MPPIGNDRILYWPLLLTVVWLLAAMLALMAPFPGDFALAASVALLWGSSAFIVGGVAVSWFKERRWYRFFSGLILPAVTLIAVLNYGFTFYALLYGSELMRVWVKMPWYLADIAQLPTDQGPRFDYFEWDSMFSISKGVVYDESDEITKPAAERSAAWKTRADILVACGLLGSAPAGRHFYIVEIGC